MSSRTVLRSVGAAVLVPAFVLAQGYRDIRAQLIEGGAQIDIANRVTAIAQASPAWPEAILGVVLAVVLVAVVFPARRRSWADLVPLLVATALLTVVLVVGMAVVDPIGLELWRELDASDVSLWVRTGVLSPALPAMLGLLLVLCAHSITAVRRHDRAGDTTQL